MKNGEIVVPGTVLAKECRGVFKPGRGTIFRGNDIVSVFVGLVNVRGAYINITPLGTGVYIPAVGDLVIGRVIERTATKWIADINSPYRGILRPPNAIERQHDRRGGRGGRGGGRGPRMSPEEEMSMYKLGEMFSARVVEASRTSEPDLTTLGKGLGKLKGGMVMKISPVKVPRVIGKRASMIKLINEGTNVHLRVAQNGVIHLRGRSRADEIFVMGLIDIIEHQSHTSGLTDRINELINERNRN
ncbi:MAG: KH domain-containing protein [Promethearchaeota archaeon]